MISVNLVGRGGNQMFQAAACIAHANRMNVEYGIPVNTTNNQIWPNFLKNFQGLNFIAHGGHIPVFQEPRHGYTPLPVMKEGRLHGYFQSYKYFEDYEDEIKQLFGFKFTAGLDCVSIHIRRGDYLLYHDKHPAVNMEYLQPAMEMFPHDTFMVFSDDLPWCHKHLKGDRFHFSEGKSALIDMHTMACCKHNIISNSTFSWWSAYGNNNPDKIVVTPDESNWFGPGNKHLDVSTLIPESWTRIKY